MEEHAALEIDEKLGAQHGKETRRSKWQLSDSIVTFIIKMLAFNIESMVAFNENHGSDVPYWRRREP